MNRDLDRSLMARAVALSREHMEKGAGGPFGALIADAGGRIVSEGWNCVTSNNDPTAHAEMVAIRRACQSLGRFDLAGHVIYSSCEPCPMCLAAVYWARLDRLVFANGRDEAASIGFDDAFLYAEIPKPLGERAIPTEQQSSPEAAAVFADWLKKPDRVEY